MSKKEILFISRIDVISNKGFFNTRISYIIKVVNLSIGTFYNYFTYKNNLLYNIFLDMNTRFYNIINSISIMSISSVDKLDIIIEKLYMEATSNKKMFKIFSSEILNLSNILSNESVILDGQYKGQLKDVNPHFLHLTIKSLITHSILLSSDIYTPSPNSIKRKK